MSKKKTITIFVICAAVIALLATSVPYALSALFNAADFTHVKDSDVEPGTLIVGSHLIYLSAINDELYLKAKDTVADSMNENTYYKSELANGQWYEISSAASIADITTDGVPVNATVIEGLNLRWHTKSDKMTYDLLTGQTVSIFDTDDPYNLWKRKELEPVKNQYDNFAEMDPQKGSDLFSYNFLKSFYTYAQAAVHTAETDACDAELKALQAFYEEQAKDDAPADELEFINKAQSSVNARREILIMANIEPFIELLNDAVNGKSRVGYDDTDDATRLCDSTFTPEHVYDEDNPPPDNDYSSSDMLKTAVTTAITSMSDTVTDNEAKLIGAGTTTLAKAQTERMSTLSSKAVSKEYNEAEAAVKELVLLDNIGNSMIVKSKEEEEIIWKKLIPAAMESYKQKLKAGESAEYKNERSLGATLARLNKLLKNQINEANADRGELEFFISAAVDREEPAEALKNIDELIAGVNVLWALPKTDDYKPVCTQSITEYKEWLEQKKKDIEALLNVGSELDGLLAEREEAILEKAIALDKNDLNGANKAEAKINALDARIEALGGDPTGVSGALKDALDALNNGDLNSLQEAVNALDALSTVAPNAVADALTNLAQAITTKLDAETAAGSSGNNVASGSAIGTGVASGSAIGTGVASGSAIGTGSDTGDGSGDGSGDGQKSLFAKSLSNLLDGVVRLATEKGNTMEGLLDVDSLLGLLASLLGGDLNDLSPDVQASAVLALHMFAEFTHSPEVKDIVEELSGRFYRQGNIYFYIQYKGMYEYIPLYTLSECMDYRYLFDNSLKKVVLSEGRDYYEFRAYSDAVKTPASQEELEERKDNPGSVDEVTGIATTTYFANPDGTAFITVKEDEMGKIIESYKEEYMKTQALFRDDVYVEETYCKEKLQWESYYLIRGDKAICANEPIITLAELLYDKLVEATLIK